MEMEDTDDYSIKSPTRGWQSVPEAKIDLDR